MHTPTSHLISYIICITIPPPPTSTLFPYTTLFRSTLVKSRDAMIVADQLLYSSNPTDETAPGMHRALIERIFAAKELGRSEEHTSELQSQSNLVCRLLLEKKKKKTSIQIR